MNDSYVENRLNQIGLSDEIDYNKRKREKRWKTKGIKEAKRNDEHRYRIY